MTHTLDPHLRRGHQLAGRDPLDGSSALIDSASTGSFESISESLSCTRASELRHFKQALLYRSPLPRTKLTSPMPAASFDGTIELPGRTLQLDGWRGMVGHNWGAEHAARWIWLHGIDFREDTKAWLDVALGRVLVAGRLTPWIANGAICIDGRRSRLGGLGARGLKVAESAGRCSLTLPGERGLLVEAHVNTPPGSSAQWRYADPGPMAQPASTMLSTARWPRSRSTCGLATRPRPRCTPLTAPPMSWARLLPTALCRGSKRGTGGRLSAAADRSGKRSAA